MLSVWTDTVSSKRFGRLHGDRKTDVLIVGGGMAGILCAYKLKRAGIDYMLVEKDRIFGGVTCNTTAKITSQHGLCYEKLIKRFGLQKATLYFEANESAVAEYRALSRVIPCDFEEKSSFVYSLDNRKKLEKELFALQKIGCKAKLEENLPLALKTVGAVRVDKQAQFNPLMFLSEISKDLNIYENTEIKEFVGNTAVYSDGKIQAQNIVIATHFPIINKHGSYFLKLYQSRSYVLGLENAQQVDGMYIDESTKGLSFRNYGDILLLGGGAHRTGKGGCGWDELKQFASVNYLGAKEVYRWATQDCMSLDGAAYIGKYSSKTNNLFVLSGFNKWGVTQSMIGAGVICDLICKKKNPYEELFSPSRSILRPQLALNAFEFVSSVLTFSKKRCPHMGCTLKYNSCEHTWDCPCHGSRFEKSGKIIENPATGDLKKTIEGV